MSTPRRRRRRAEAPQGEPQRAVEPEPQSHQDPSPKRQAKARPSRGHPTHGSGERGLRDLAGAGTSQVGLSAALRARAVNRPNEDDLAAAERDLEIVRRHWRPQAES